MVGWHHRLDGHEFEQAPGVGDGQGSLACYSPWGHKELDMTEQLNWTELTRKKEVAFLIKEGHKIMKTTEVRNSWLTTFDHNLSGTLYETIENMDEDAKRECCTWDPSHGWLPTEPIFRESVLFVPKDVHHLTWCMNCGPKEKPP